MKSLIVLALIFSMPLMGHCDESLLTEEELLACTCFPDVVFDHVIAKQIRKTDQNIAKLSDYNYTVKYRCDEFLTQLHMAYLNGEGLIEKDVLRILDAMVYCARKHQFRTDASGLPYIAHCLDVANRLFSLGKVRDADILIAALIHETLDETDVTFSQISEHFGVRVEAFVSELYFVKGLSKRERAKLEIFEAKGKSAGAAQIILVEKLCKLEGMLQFTTQEWSQDRSDRYVIWSSMVVNALPWVNAPLKKAVDATIEAYWHQH